MVRALSGPLSGDFGPVPPPIPEIAAPWAKHLPAEALDEFARELTEELERADPASLTHLLAAWRATVESYADPEFMAALQEVGQNLGPVPCPGVSPSAARRFAVIPRGGHSG